MRTAITGKNISASETESNRKTHQKRRERKKMNRLYVIKWLYKNGYLLSTNYFWNENEAKEKMHQNPEWKYTLKEATKAHKIWIAR